MRDRLVFRGDVANESGREHRLPRWIRPPLLQRALPACGAAHWSTSDKHNR